MIGRQIVYTCNHPTNQQKDEVGKKLLICTRQRNSFKKWLHQLLSDLRIPLKNIPIHVVYLEMESVG